MEVIKLNQSYPTPLVSIIVLNWNCKEYLGHCLDSILKNAYPNFEVIFVDNASTDGSVEFIERRFRRNPRIKILSNSRNLGLPIACNQGSKLAKGKYLVFLNSDTEVDKKCLVELVKVMESDSRIGAAQSKLLKNHTGRIQCIGNIYDHYCVYQRMIGSDEIDRGQYKRLRVITFADSAGMIIRRRLFEEIGLFDPKYFLYHESIDLGWRILIAGFRIVSVPKSTVYHFGGAFLKKYGVRWAYWETKSRLSLLIKNYEFRNMVKTIPFFVLVFLGGAVAFMIKRKVLFAGAIVVGILWNILNLKYLWKRRLMVQRLIRKVPDEEVLRYFLNLFPSTILRYYLANPIQALRGQDEN